MSGPKQRTFQHAGFLVWRTPVLSFSELISWTQDVETTTRVDEPGFAEIWKRDRATLSKRLRDRFDGPREQEALFLASPGLYDSLEQWRKEPDSESGHKIEQSVLRYFVRMASRCTPFGFFAGSSMGTISSETKLELPPSADYRRHTTLDAEVLCALGDSICKDPRIADALRYRPNTSLCSVGGRLRYFESLRAGTRRWYEIFTLEPSPQLISVLEHAKAGSTAAELAAMLVAADPELGLADAMEFIEELIAAQVIVGELRPAVTGPEPIESLLDQLRQHAAASEAVELLTTTRKALKHFDQGGLGVPVTRYLELANQLKGVVPDIKPSHLFLSELVKSTPDARLGAKVVDEVARGLEIVRRISGARGSGAGVHERLEMFRDRFVERYNEQEVPLVEALDPESLLDADSMPAHESPLLFGLHLGAQGGPPPAKSPLERFFLKKLGGASEVARDEIEIDLKDVPARSDLPPWPDSFTALVTLLASSEAEVDNGNYRLVFRDLWGPSGAKLFARFCYAQPELERAVRAYTSQEQQLAPDTILAELVHLPPDNERMGNVIYRPVLRSYEIPYLGSSGAPTEQQLPITDLLVSVVGGRIVLQSRSLGKWVIPRLTSAHNFLSPLSLPIYRFLGLLQHQGVFLFSISWPDEVLASSGLPYLPRIAVGRVLLSLARWQLRSEEVARVSKAQGAERFRAVQQLRRERALPRFVTLADLVIDLDNALSVESFVQELKKTSKRIVIEYPGPDELVAHGPDGVFANELAVPFIITEPRKLGARLPSASATIEQTNFPPGSEWLFAKVYAGVSAADELLVEVVEPLVAELRRCGAIDSWFFIRYADPDHHLRVRFHGDPGRLSTEVLPALHARLREPIAHRRIFKFQLDTYQREIERYGGLVGTRLAEQIFEADSDAIVAILARLGNDDEGMRWQLALRGVDALLDDLGLSAAEKLEAIRSHKDALDTEFGVGVTSHKKIGENYRKDAKVFERLLDPSQDLESPFSPGLEPLRLRSERVVPIVAALRDAERSGTLTKPVLALAMSYLHMHVNRLLRSDQRASEMVITNYLYRIYDGRRARARSSQSASQR